MISCFFRYCCIIIFFVLLPTYSIAKDVTHAVQSEAKKVNGKVKNAENHSWTNREEGVLQQHSPTLASADIPFFDENGQAHNFDEFYGKVLLVNFWATWCMPCREEMPALSKLQKDFRRKNFKVLAISGDFKGVDAIKEFYQTHKIKNLPVYHDPKNTLSKSFDITGIPTSLIIDAEGYEIARIFGSFVDWESDELRQFILDQTDQKTYDVPVILPETEITNTPPGKTTPAEPTPAEAAKTEKQEEKELEISLPEKAITTIENITTIPGDLSAPKLRRAVNQ